MAQSSSGSLPTKIVEADAITGDKEKMGSKDMNLHFLRGD